MDIEHLMQVSHVEWRSPALIIPVCDPDDSSSFVNIDIMKWMSEQPVFERDGLIHKASVCAMC